MTSTNTMSNNSLLPTLLLVLFIALKLCHVIDWSWWWVMAPLWVPIAIFLLVFAVRLAGKRR